MTEARFTARKGSQRAIGGGILTTADLVVLSLLAERAMHGYELLGEYDRQEVSDWASVSKAQVYYALQKLAELRLIKASGASEARDRTVFRATASGKRHLASALSSTDWARSRVPQPFATWLGLSIHCPPDDVMRVLTARLAFLDESLARERSSLDYIKTLTSARARAGEAVVELVIRHMEVERDWVSGLISKSDQA